MAKRIFETTTMDLCFRVFRIANNAETADGSNQGNTTEIVRYVRRRKFGRKRRSIYVKCRVINKTESSVVNNDDEHSQEYIARRRDSIANESTKEEEDEEQQEQKAEVETEKKEKTPPSSPNKSPVKQPTFKQLTLDQFLKKIPNNSPVSDKPKNEIKVENKTDTVVIDTNEIKTEAKDNNNDANDEELLLSKRSRKLSNTSHMSKSETDLTKIINGESTETTKKPNCKYYSYEDSCMQPLKLFR